MSVDVQPERSVLARAREARAAKVRMVWCMVVVVVVVVVGLLEGRNVGEERMTFFGGDVNERWVGCRCRCWGKRGQGEKRGWGIHWQNSGMRHVTLP
jgi:hypothetical protein